MTKIIQPSRRGFITGLTSLIVAPAIVRVENIMPVKSLKLLSIKDIDDEFFNYHTADSIAYGMMFIKQDWVKNSFVQTQIPLKKIYEIKI